MSSIYPFEKLPCYSSSDIKHCNCRIVTDLEPFHVFEISRPESMIREVIEPHKTLKTVFISHTPNPQSPQSNSYSEISPQELTKLYLVIADKEWVKDSNEFETLIQILNESSLEVKEIIFSLLKRLQQGLSKVKQPYSEEALKELILSGVVKRKGYQNFRKRIVGAFYTQKL